MAYEALLISSVFLPLVTSPLPMLLHRELERKVAWLTLLIILYSAATLAALAAATLSGRAEGYIWHAQWASALGLTFGLRADGLGILLALTIAFTSCLVLVYSTKYMEGKGDLGLFYSLYLLFAGGMLGTVMATDLIEFFVFFEVMLVSSWAFVHRWGTGAKESIALRYLLYSEVGALSLLVGILATGAVYETFDLLVIGEVSSSGLPVSLDTARAIAFAMLVGLMVKLAIFPFHTWLPDTYSEAPIPIAAVLPLMTGIGGYGILRLVYTAYTPVMVEFSYGLSILALVTMTYGGLVALTQKDISRLLAYSSISQEGYMLLGLSSATALGLSGAIFHYFSHGVAKAVLFMIVGVLIYKVGSRSMERFGGLAGKMPYTATAMVIALISIAGAPPFNGFHAEWMIFLGSIIHGVTTSHIPTVAITVAALIATLLTVGYALWTIKRTLFSQTPAHLMEVREAPNIMLIPIIALAVLIILTGVYPQLVNSLLNPSIEALIPPAPVPSGGELVHIP